MAAASPLPVFGASVHTDVTSAGLELAQTARLGHLVRDTGGGDGVRKGRLPVPCVRGQKKQKRKKT